MHAMRLARLMLAAALLTGCGQQPGAGLTLSPVKSRSAARAQQLREAGTLAMRFQLPRAGYVLAATSSEIATLTVKLTRPEAPKKVVATAQVARREFVSGAANVRFDALALGRYAVGIVAADATGAVLGGCDEQADVTAGRTTRLAARLRLSPASALGGLAIDVSIEDGEPAPPATPGGTPGRRGLNLGNYLEESVEGGWSPTRKLREEDFRRIRAAGFDFVRIPIRWSAHAQAQTPWRVDEAFLARVDWVLARCRAEGLGAIVDFHHYRELMVEPAAHSDRFLGIWRQVAARYADQPANVWFEVLNEPADELASTARWSPLQNRAIAAIRFSNPTRKLVVGGGDYNGAHALGDLALPADRNLVGTFHYYGPMYFTHQGAEWSSPRYRTTGVVFPGPPAVAVKPVDSALADAGARKFFEGYNKLAGDANPCSAAGIRRDLAVAKAWSDRTGHPVFLGEFGVIERADAGSRERWTRAVREESERLGFSWAYWEYSAGFGLFDHKSGQWQVGLTRALVP